MFWHVVGPLLAATAPKVIVEIGIHLGFTTEKLLEFATRHNAVVHAIDPNPAERFDSSRLAETYGDRFVLHRRPSIDTLPDIEGVDAVLIDGDHNWYTVFHELEALESKAAGGGRDFPITFLHDVDWPYGRRDLYYDPEAIPSRYRHPYEQSGLVFGEDALAAEGGAGHLRCHAVTEGTPRNGVLTAVEDFLESTDRRLLFRTVAGFHGLGILVSEERVDSHPDLSSFLEQLAAAPTLRNQCEMLETARLRERRRFAELRLQLRKERSEARRLRKRLESLEGG